MMQIVEMTQDHVAPIAELEKLCFSDPWSYETLCSEGLRAEAEFLCAFIEGEFAGYAGMLCVLDEGQICNVAVCPPFRRMGVGEALMEAQRSAGLARGLSVMMLEVRASNAPAQRLYEKLGWEKVGVRKNFYTSPREDGVLYNLYL